MALILNKSQWLSVNPQLVFAPISISSVFIFSMESTLCPSSPHYVVSIAKDATCLFSIAASSSLSLISCWIATELQAMLKYRSLIS